MRKRGTLPDRVGFVIRIRSEDEHRRGATALWSRRVHDPLTESSVHQLLQRAFRGIRFSTEPARARAGQVPRSRTTTGPSCDYLDELSPVAVLGFLRDRLAEDVLGRPLAVVPQREGSFEIH